MQKEDVECKNSNVQQIRRSVDLWPTTTGRKMPRKDNLVRNQLVRSVTQQNTERNSINIKNPRSCVIKKCPRYWDIEKYLYDFIAI